MLNGVLPSSIRCIAWASVPEGKSARFDCISRSYRYYFPK
jgi:tRNA pseudouridine38/39 synthase